MLCSVVIPWHRGIADLERSVASALAQDWRDIEVIVVANGASDADVAAARALTDDARFRVERLETAGACPARNLGMALAAGELIFLLDADDRFHPGKVSRFVDLFRSEGFDIALSRGTRIRENGLAWPWPAATWDGTQPIADFFFVDGCTISSSALVVAGRVKTRIEFARQGPFDDLNFLIRAEHAGLVIRMIPDQLYDYFDDRTENRRSASSTYDQRLAWIDNLPDNVGEKARAAARVRAVAQHRFPAEFWASCGQFADAVRLRAVPLREVLLFAVKGLVPNRFRRALTNRYLTHRAARQADASRPSAAPRPALRAKP